MENINNGVGIADGLTGIATGIYGATQQKRSDLEARRRGGRGGGNTLENIDNGVGIVDGLTGIATSIYGLVNVASSGSHKLTFKY